MRPGRLDAMLAEFATRARESGTARLRGMYSPTAKNGLVRDLYASLGFERGGTDGETTIWEYDLEAATPTNKLIDGGTGA